MLRSISCNRESCGRAHARRMKSAALFALTLKLVAFSMFLLFFFSLPVLRYFSPFQFVLFFLPFPPFYSLLTVSVYFSFYFFCFSLPIPWDLSGEESFRFTLLNHSIVSSILFYTIYLLPVQFFFLFLSYFTCDILSVWVTWPQKSCFLCQASRACTLVSHSHCERSALSRLSNFLSSEISTLIGVAQILENSPPRSL